MTSSWEDLIAISIARQLLTGLVLMAQITAAFASDFRLAQWRAAKAFYLVANHHAFPTFGLNPVFSSDIVNVGNDTIAIRGAICFTKRSPQSLPCPR
jgi:hypothetical protein